MGQIILFYSFTGKTRDLAIKKCEELGADKFEVKETKRRGVFNALLVGARQAMKHKTVPVEPIDIDLGAYEKIIIMMPIWAGFPAPAFNNVVALLPEGKQVELVMLSGSGVSKKEKIIEQVRLRGCEVTAYSDVKA